MVSMPKQNKKRKKRIEKALLEWLKNSVPGEVLCIKAAVRPCIKL